MIAGLQLARSIGRFARRSNSRTEPGTLHPAPTESDRLIQLRDDLDVMRRDRDNAKSNLETCWVEQKRTLEKLDECVSLKKHWEGEVERVQNDYQEQLRSRDNQSAIQGAKIAELAQALNTSETKLADLAVPRGRLKIIKGRYRAVHPETNEMKEADVTDILDSRVLDERLVLNELYQTIFPEPMRHVRKSLTIDYLHNGRPFSVTVIESTKIALPFPYEDIPFPA